MIEVVVVGGPPVGIAFEAGWERGVVALHPEETLHGGGRGGEGRVRRVGSF